MADVEGNVVSGGLQILDGSGTGQLAHVTREGQIRSMSEIHSLQHHVSRHSGQAFQVIGNSTHTGGSGSDTYTVLHIKNISSSKWLLITYIRLQAILSTTGDSEDYFSLGFGTEYSLNGGGTTPVNINRQSGNEADVVCKQSLDDDPITVTGTFTEMDRWYSDGASMMTFNKEGSVILGHNNTFESRFTTVLDGTFYTRVTFMYVDPAE